MFTYEPIMERILSAVGEADEAGQGFIKNWKEKFIRELTETAEDAVGVFAEDYDHFKNTGEVLYSMTFGDSREPQNRVENSKNTG